MNFVYPNRMDVILFVVLVVTEKNHLRIEVLALNLLKRSRRKGMTIYSPCDQITTTNEK